jgi:hypothetical protein
MWLLPLAASEQAKRVQRFGADMVFDPFRIAPRRVRAYAERDQKGFDNAMPIAGFSREALA